MTGPAAVAEPFRNPKTSAEVLSDAALDLATQKVDSTLATGRLLEQSDRNRELMEAAHSAHLQRMAQRPSNDFAFQRALGIIETALRQLPRPASPRI